MNDTLVANSPSPSPNQFVLDHKQQVLQSVSDKQRMENLSSLQQQMKLKAVLSVQKNIRANLIRIKLKEEFKKIHRRKKIIKQLVETEESYIRDLGFIVSDFKMRMQSRAILTAEEGRKLFSNVDEIRQLHDIFFSTLYNHFSKYHPYLIIFSDVLNCILFFRIYIEYLNNFPAACDLLDEYKKSKPAFASFIAEISRLPQYRFLSLQDYMVKPVQRLPKYVLLLKQLLKNTQTSHPDYQNVKKALQQFEEVNNNNNEKLNKIRNSFKLRELETLLQLPEGIITPSTQFLFEESVLILSQQNNSIISNCVVYLLNNTIIVSKRCGALLSKQSQINNLSSHSSRISRASGFGPNFMKQKLEAIVPLKYGTSIKLNKDQCFYKNSFTVQSAEGESCTFICSNQEELHNLYSKIKKQSEIVVQQVIFKLKSMFQSQNINHNNTFIKAISLLDRVPEVNVLGTSERTDKMLKYTIYIVEIKIKMIKQKIFLRFSQLLELQKFISAEYGNKISIKQGLVSSSWLNNHHQKTIEQRKMNIQRFLKEILSKPEVMENGWKILLKLGLPLDFYELPQKLLENKNTESFIKKSSVVGKSSIFKKKNFKQTKNNQKFRMSLFQQQKLEQLQEQQQDQEEQTKFLIKQSFQHFENVNPKSSYGSSQGQKTLCIQDLLKANEVNLGHYTRMESIDLSRDSFNQMDKISTATIDLQILVPCLSNLYISNNEQMRKKDTKYIGFRAIKIKCTKLQRVQNIIPLLAKQIPLHYYKDFRLLIQKQYYQRILEDDELVHKLIGEINRTKSSLVFRKVIYIEQQIEQKELANDKERLSILAGQIINQIKLGKYRLNYENYLKFSVLSAVVYKEHLPKRQALSKETLQNLAKQARLCIFPKYSSLSQTQDVWIKDFVKAYQIIQLKLHQISKVNHVQIQKQKQESMVEFHEEENAQLFKSFWANTSVKYLALLSIVKQMEKNDLFYGCIQFPVQISDQFKNYLQIQSNSDLQNSQTYITRSSLDSQGLKIGQESSKPQRKLSDEENKNCWLGIKHSKVMFSSITKGNFLLELDYENIVKIETYSSAVHLELRNLQINRIKLKTTSSYYIRQMLVYYKNYRQILKKICTDSDLRQSIIGMTREQIGTDRQQQMDELYV